MICDEVFVRSEPTIPEMLIVLDKSGSMIWPGCDAVDILTGLLIGCPNPPPPYDAPFDRWAPSVAAIKGLTQQLQGKISFGLMIFPGGTADCGAGTVVVDPALNNAAQIASALDMAEADGSSTPTAGSLEVARDYLHTEINPDAIEPPKYILLVTDGAPNCTVQGQADDSITNPTVAARDSYAAIDGLTAQDVKTYVIGYDTADIPELSTVLDEMARRGDTGDTAHRPVEDEASLIAEMETITGKLTSCTYQLSEAPGDPDYVRVTLDGVDQPQGDEGWVLANDTSIELRGPACATLQDGTKDHKLSIKVECEPVIVQ
jgi:hypothetical protein